MEDLQIVQLFLDRSEKAIEALSEKFGKYLNAIAFNVLSDKEDAEECVNDAYLRVWNSIPPQRPGCLKAFAGKITRNLALDLLDKKNALKRGGSRINIALDELSEVVGNSSDPLENLQMQELTKCLNDFLEALPSDKRILFMKRYWYLMSVRDIAKEMDMTEANVKTSLFRVRKQLKEELTKEGINI